MNIINDIHNGYTKGNPSLNPRQDFTHAHNFHDYNFQHKEGSFDSVIGQNCSRCKPRRHFLILARVRQ
jgi:hypothetical protein